jgi:hypothetical protein
VVHYLQRRDHVNRALKMKINKSAAAGLLAQWKHRGRASRVLMTEKSKRTMVALSARLKQDRRMLAHLDLHRDPHPYVILRCKLRRILKGAQFLVSDIVLRESSG